MAMREYQSEIEFMWPPKSATVGEKQCERKRLVYAVHARSMLLLQFKTTFKVLSLARKYKGADMTIKVSPTYAL